MRRQPGADDLHHFIDVRPPREILADRCQEFEIERRPLLHGDVA